MGYSIQDFPNKYHFEKAQIYLVPVIPGDYCSYSRRDDDDDANYNKRQNKSSNINDKNDRNNNNNYSKNGMNRISKRSSRTFYYGHQRVQYILNTMAKSIPKISKRTSTANKSDRLILQPTSLGSDWTRSQFASLVRGYMGYHDHNNQTNNNNYDHYRDDFWVCGQADIVWPSDKMMLSMGGRSVLAANTITAQGNKQRHQLTQVKGGNFVFNSSKTFNACELEFISRMKQYIPSTPSQTLYKPKVPHFKSIARLFVNHKAMHKCDVAKADQYFSWFLLTSACLSHGAQGVPVIDETRNHGNCDKKEKCKQRCFSYRNFELGVLFTSHLPKKTDQKTKTCESIGSNNHIRNRVYCFRPHECSCQYVRSSPTSRKTEPSLIHLPVPYHLRPASYFHCDGDQDDDDGYDSDSVCMVVDPFFHEVLDSSRCVGNMLLTPFGQRLAKSIAARRYGK